MKNSTDEIIEKLKSYHYNETFDISTVKEYFLDALNELSKLNTEVKFYRDFIHDNGLEFEAMRKYANWLCQHSK